MLRHSRTAVWCMFVVALLLGSGAARGVLTEPEFTFFGTLTSNGVLVQEGVVTAVLEGETVAIATYELGSVPEYGDRYVLRIPLDFGDPQLPGTARPGDAIELFVDGEAAGIGMVGERGEVDVVGLDPFFDDDPELSVADTAVAEGDVGTTHAEFTVSLSRAVSWDVEFDFETVDGTAVAPGDYTAVADTGLIPAGESSVTVMVPVSGDGEPEPNESFQMILSNPVDEASAPASIATVIADGEAVGMIGADDTQYVISVADVQVLESDAGETVEAVFIVSVPNELPTASQSSGDPGIAPPVVMLEVDYSTSDGTAIAGEDYTATSGRLTIDTAFACAGSVDPCGEIRVPIMGNTHEEPDETFTVELSNPSDGVIGRGQAQGTILDDEHLLLFVERETEGVDGALGLVGAVASAVSPDGAHLYSVAQAGNSLSVFDRAAENGALAFRSSLVDGGGGVDGLGGASSLALSPDGLQVYTAGYLDDAVAVFDRDPGTGDLTFSESHTQGVGGVTGIDGAASVAVSADGSHVYVAGLNSDALAVFERAGDGTLMYASTVQNGTGGVSGLLGAASVALSPGGEHAYVASSIDSSLVAFARDASTGALTFVERETDGVGGVDGLDGAASVAVSPDGTHVYAVGQFDDAIAVFERSVATGELTFVERKKNNFGGIMGLDGASGVAVDASGEYVYAGSQLDSSLAVFSRDSATGGLTFVEARRDGDPDPDGLPDAAGVRRLDGLAGGAGVAVSPGPAVTNIYLAGPSDDAVAVFLRDGTPPDAPVVSVLSHLPGVWSNNPIVSFEWTTAETGGAGLGGYPYLADTEAATDPGVALAQAHVGADGDTQSAVIGPWPDSDSNYFHLRACDRADNCGPPAHLGAFKIDTVRPAPPTNVVSVSHAVHELTPGAGPATDGQSVITMSWTSASDELSGIDGYAYAFDPSPTWVCSEVKQLGGGAVGVASPPLADGVHYFHICSVDQAGNWSDAVSAGAFFVGLHGFAGPDHTIFFGHSVVLGESPVAVGGTPPYTYLWTVVPSAGATLSSSVEPNPTLKGELTGDLTVRLVVSDSAGGVSAVSEAIITVVCAPNLDLFNLVSPFGVVVETALGKISAEQYQVAWGSEVTFRAGQEIVLGEGFAVDEEAQFTAFVNSSLVCPSVP